jgi:hypothetical protein
MNTRDEIQAVTSTAERPWDRDFSEEKANRTVQVLSEAAEAA